MKKTLYAMNDDCTREIFFGHAFCIDAEEIDRLAAEYEDETIWDDFHEASDFEIGYYGTGDMHEDRTVYVVKSDRIGGDSFDIMYTFSVDDARKAAARHINHLTDYEKSENSVHIDGYKIKVFEGQTPEGAFRFETDSAITLPDPDFYETVNEKDD